MALILAHYMSIGMRKDGVLCIVGVAGMEAQGLISVACEDIPIQNTDSRPGIIASFSSLFCSALGQCCPIRRG